MGKSRLDCQVVSHAFELNQLSRISVCS